MRFHLAGRRGGGFASGRGRALEVCKWNTGSAGGGIFLAPQSIGYGQAAIDIPLASYAVGEIEDSGIHFADTSFAEEAVWRIASAVVPD